MTPSLRSLLFAPATRADVMRKLPRSCPDAVALDLEDAVPASGKEQARANVLEVGPELAMLEDGPSVIVRVNAVDSEFFDGDIARSLFPGLTGVAVPKLEAAVEVAEVRGALAAAGFPELMIIAGIESAPGVQQVTDVVNAGVGACYFGAEDFVADMAGVRTATNREVLYARSRVALAARVAGVAAIDMIVADIADHDRFSAEAAEARSLGFTGKLCIHPGQVELANTAFLPTPDEVDRAQRIVDAYEAAVAEGQAAIAVDGQMIDEALARQARTVLAAIPPKAG